MLVEIVVAALLGVLTTLITKMIMKKCHIESKCSKCCDVEIETDHD